MALPPPCALEIDRRGSIGSMRSGRSRGSKGGSYARISLPGLPGYEPGILQMERKSGLSLNQDVPLQRQENNIEAATADSLPCGETSSMASGMNLVTTMVGAGILSFPGVFAKGGWYVAPFVLLVCAGIIIEIGNVLCKCMVMVEESHKRGRVYNFGIRPECYDHLMEAAFGRCGKVISLVAVNGLMLLICGAYLILIGISLEYVVQQAFWSPYRACVLSVSVVFIPLSMLDDMSLISRLSVIGVIASVVYVLTIASAGIQTGMAGEIDVWIEDLFVKRAQEYRNLPESMLDVISIVSVMMLGYTFQMTLPTIRAEMAHPEELPKTICSSVGCVTMIYGIAGSAGYYGWGLQADVTGNVLKNMVHEQKPMLAGIALSTAIIANLCVTFPIFMSVVSRAAEAASTGRYCAPIRLGLFSMCLLVALFIPFFMEFLELISSLMAVSVGVLMPLAMYWKLRSDNGHNWREAIPEVLLHVVIAIIGFAATVFGTYAAVLGLMNEMEKGSGDFWAYSK